MKIALWASGSRGVSVATQALDAGHEVATVIVPFDRKDIGEAICADTGAELFTVVSSLHQKLTAQALEKSDLGVVSGFPFRIPFSLFSLPNLGTVNLHGGPLPQYRGGSPLSWQLVNGAEEIGLSLHLLQEQLDTGPVLMEKSFPVSEHENISVVKKKADELFGRMVRELLSNPRLLDTAAPQDEKEAGYWHQRSYDDAEIFWDRMSNLEVHNLVRAVSPDYGGAFSFLQGVRVKIYEVALSNPPLMGTPGRVILFGPNTNPQIVCRKGGVELVRFEFDTGELSVLEKRRLRNGDRLSSNPNIPIRGNSMPGPGNPN